MFFPKTLIFNELKNSKSILSTFPVLRGSAICVPMLKNLLFCTLLFAISCSADRDELSTVVTDTPPSALSSSELSEFSSNMLSEVNALRTQGCTCGNVEMPAVSALSWNNKLYSSADRHAYDMQTQNFFNHKGSDNSKVGDRTFEAGYSWSTVAENIALVSGDISEVVEGWKNSPNHCKQMMSADYKELGAAQRGDYWVQVFGAQIGE